MQRPGWELTNDLQVDVSLGLAVFVLDDDVVAALVGLDGVFQAVLGSVSGVVDVVPGEAEAVVLPVSLGLWVGAVGHHHDEGLPSVRHVVLVRGLDLRGSWEGQQTVTLDFDLGQDWTSLLGSVLQGNDCH